MKNWEQEAGGYAWDPKSGDDSPIKENDHLMDSMRYFVMTKRVYKPKRR
jgi:phage terminase large subunit